MTSEPLVVTTGPKAASSQSHTNKLLSDPTVANFVPQGPQATSFTGRSSETAWVHWSSAVQSGREGSPRVWPRRVERIDHDSVGLFISRSGFKSLSSLRFPANMEAPRDGCHSRTRPFSAPAANSLSTNVVILIVSAKQGFSTRTVRLDTIAQHLIGQIHTLNAPASEAQRQNLPTPSWHPLQVPCSTHE